jgi:hypothetical protein
VKLGFEEEQGIYASGSQNARAWTERWVKDWAFCPNCGASSISPYPANRPVADFFCSNCNEDYELKSQKNKFGAKVVDGAFKTMRSRLESATNPNLLLLNYDIKQLSVRNLFVVPKFFFAPKIIEERKPLVATARRAGWVGCNILLDQIPSAGKIFIVRDGIVRPKEDVLHQWQRILFLRDEGIEARGWLLDVMKCVERIGRQDFSIDDVYAFENHLSQLYPNNKHVKQKIRQQLQVLRDQGYLEFISRGNYRLRASEQFAR